MKYINKKKSIVEIIICFSLMLFLTVFVNIFGKDFGLWLGILTYWLSSFLCFRFPFASVRNLFGVESWTCSRKGMFAAPAVPKQLHRLGTTVS